MDISIIIVNWNTRKLLLDCLSSIYMTIKNLSFEVWVVDNASSDDSVEAARTQFPDINIIENSRNLGFAAANNRAFRRMKGRYALLLNTDTVLREGAINELHDFMEANPKTAMA